MWPRHAPAAGAFLRSSTAGEATPPARRITQPVAIDPPQLAIPSPSPTTKNSILPSGVEREDAVSLPHYPLINLRNATGRDIFQKSPRQTNHHHLLRDSSRVQGDPHLLHCFLPICPRDPSSPLHSSAAAAEEEGGEVLTGVGGGGGGGGDGEEAAGLRGAEREREEGAVRGARGALPPRLRAPEGGQEDHLHQRRQPARARPEAAHLPAPGEDHCPDRI